jgi:tRNA (pseudouridine54-N1)-methyltransferase
VRRFVIIGRTALADAGFSLEDLPSSSGRLDVLLRAVRAAFLISHGLRRDVEVYLILQGGSEGPRTLRISGQSVKFLRPDERSLAILVQKTLAAAPASLAAEFVELRPGLCLRRGELQLLGSELGGVPRFVLEEGAPDLRDSAASARDAWFFIGDHLGFDEPTRRTLAELGCTAVSVGPVSLHTDDVVTLIGSELDRTVSATDPA